MEYQLRAKLPRFKHRIDTATKILLSFTKGGDCCDRDRVRTGRVAPPQGEHECYISISWGKDSTVLLHLAHSVLQAVNAISVQYGTPCGDDWNIEPCDRWPDLTVVRDEFLARYPVNYYERFVESFWYLCERYNCCPITVDMSGGGKNIDKVEKIFLKSFSTAIDNEANRRHFSGNIMGMRRDESRNRQRHFAMRGHTYYNADRSFWCCNPLYDWTGDDIWTYIVKHDLPYSELYDASGFDRNTLRNGLMIGGGMMRYGAYVHLKRMYPRLWNEVCGKYPYLRAFAG